MDREGERPPERPDYNVYRSGSAGKAKSKKQEPKKEGADKGASKAGASDKPDYKVYRSRRGPLAALRKPDIASLRRKAQAGGGFRDRLSTLGGEIRRRRWLRWVLLAIVGWVAISFISFAISAQIQKSKLDDSAKKQLSKNPFVLGGQNILVLGGDARGKVGGKNPAISSGEPQRADTIMVVHAGAFSFRKLSIPRDTFAEVPGAGAQKINAAFAIDDPTCGDDDGCQGNAGLMIRTVEDLLGIDIDHVVIVDFDGFVDFINTLGGIKIHLDKPVCGEISGGRANGGQTIHLGKGDHTLQGGKALAVARIRKNTCAPAETDLDRAKRQQLLLNGIKGRLISPLRVPINFIRGPWIGWNAPRAIISDMGALTMPQLAIAAVTGGSPGAQVLKPSSSGPGGSLVVSDAERRRAVKKLVGD